MRHLSSDQMADFAAIYDEDVELVSVARPRMESVRASCDQWSTSHAAVQARWEQAPGDRDAPSSALPTSLDPRRQGALIDEIARASELLGELLGCERIGVRISSLRAPMCPRFHVDRVPCRMLITIIGPGTEWIPSDDVDWPAFADRNSEASPVQAGRNVRQLATGSWSLLKGGAWNEQFAGVVHRSPHGGDERLLMSMDPLFASGNGRDESPHRH